MTNEPDRSKLSELYPRPKTYDELQYDRKMARIIRRQRFPHWRNAATAASLTIATLCATLSVFLAAFLFGFGVLAGVSFSFMLGLIAIGVVILALHTVSKWYDITGQATGKLAALYIFVLMPLYGVMVQTLQPIAPLYIVIPTALLVHYGLIALVARLLYGKTPGII